MHLLLARASLQRPAKLMQRLLHKKETVASVKNNCTAAETPIHALLSRSEVQERGFGAYPAWAVVCSEEGQQRERSLAIMEKCSRVS